MIKSSVKHHFLITRPAFYRNTTKLFFPSFTGNSPYFFEIKTVLLRIQIFTSVSCTYKRNADLHFNCFTFRHIVCEIRTDIITGNISSVSGIEFPCSGGIIPCCFGSHFSLFLPIPGSNGFFIDTHHEIDGKNSLRIVTKCSQHFHPFYFCIADATHPRSAFIGKSFTQIHQNICLPFWKSKAGNARACGC